VNKLLTYAIMLAYIQFFDDADRIIECCKSGNEVFL